MEKAKRSITAVLSAVVLLSGCAATPGSKTQPTPSSAETAPTPTVAPSSPAASTPPTTTPKPTTATPRRAVAGTALAAAAGLTVKGRAPKTGYTRAQFGQTWYDTDRNGCDTRNDILRRDLASKDMKNACKVLAGTLAPDPYTGSSIRFVYGGASEIDIDHVVALSDAWQKGAATWPAGRRLALANDPLNLLAVDAAANRSKGDGDTATWLPPNKSYRCTYVARQVAVKSKYGIWVTAAERKRHDPRPCHLPDDAPARARIRADCGGDTADFTEARARPGTPRTFPGSASAARRGRLLQELHRRSCGWCQPDPPWRSWLLTQARPGWRRHRLRVNAPGCSEGVPGAVMPRPQKDGEPRLPAAIVHLARY